MPEADESALSRRSPGARLAAHVLAPLEGEVRWMGETRTRFLATGDTTDSAFSLVDETARRGEAIPLHRHPEDPESFYILEGEIIFHIEDQPGLSARAGAFVHLPAGIIHGFRIASDTARYLILTTPRHGEFYRAISVRAGADGLPDGPAPDWEQILATAERFGIQLISKLPDD